MKKQAVSAASSTEAGPILVSRHEDGTCCEAPNNTQKCALCREIALNAEELQYHLRTAHTSFVDRLIISMCLAQAS
jgi:hypothetical protein